MANCRSRPLCPEFACPDARPNPPFAERFAPLFVGLLPPRPGVFMVRTGAFDAARFGAVRATTWRFCTAPDGREIRAPLFAAPKWLSRVGLYPGPRETRAPRNEACVT